MAGKTFLKSLNTIDIVPLLLIIVPLLLQNIG